MKRHVVVHGQRSGYVHKNLRAGLGRINANNTLPRSYRLTHVIGSQPSTLSKGLGQLPRRIKPNLANTIKHMRKEGRENQSYMKRDLN